jgi:hypothetical protein
MQNLTRHIQGQAGTLEKGWLRIHLRDQCSALVLPRSIVQGDKESVTQAFNLNQGICIVSHKCFASCVLAHFARLDLLSTLE